MRIVFVNNIFREQWRLSQKKRTIDERLDMFREMKKLSFFKNEQTDIKTNEHEKLKDFILPNERFKINDRF